MARKTREDALKTREGLLDAALELFSTAGFDNTNLADIARKANVTRGAVYWYFSNKMEVFETLEAEFEQQSLDHLNDLLKVHKTASEKIFAILDLISDQGNDMARLRKLHDMEFLAGSAMRGLIEKKSNRILNAGVDMFHDIIYEGIASGEFSVSAAQAEFVVNFLVSLYIGVAFVRFAAPDRFVNNDYRLLMELILGEMRRGPDIGGDPL